jgi:tetratricopeptide (TPR) repeat protein
MTSTRLDIPQSHDLPESGQLRDTPVPQLLLSLHRQSFDGALTLRCDRGSKTIGLTAGAPSSVTSTLRSESLGAQLVEQGLIDRQQHAQVEQKVADSGCREAVALLSLKIIDPKSLFRELKDQVKRCVVEAFAWSDGSFELSPAAEKEQADAIGSFRCDPLRLVQQGLTQYWTAERILTDLAERMQQFPSARNEMARMAARLEAAGGGGGLLLGFDGSKPLGQLIGPSMSSMPALASLWIVDALSLIAYSDTPSVATRGGDHDFETEIEIAAVGAAESESQAMGQAADQSGGGAAALRKEDDIGAELKREIEQLGKDLAAPDYYQLLGVGESAKTGAIKKAYYKAAKRYHPDTLARLDLEDQKGEAARIFARIAEAFEVLTDPDKRSDYDASLRGELTKADAAQLAQAEISYRKAEILVRMGNFKAALEYLRPAVELYPSEGEYQSGLGWALYKQPDSEPEGAAFHLGKAVELSPKDPIAHFRYATVLRALGDEEPAKKHFDIASQLDS